MEYSVQFGRSGVPGFPVHHQLPELAQTHVYQVGDARKYYIFLQINITAYF